MKNPPVIDKGLPVADPYEPIRHIESTIKTMDIGDSFFISDNDIFHPTDEFKQMIIDLGKSLSMRLIPVSITKDQIQLSSGIRVWRQDLGYSFTNKKCEPDHRYFINYTHGLVCKIPNTTPPTELDLFTEITEDYFQKLNLVHYPPGSKKAYYSPSCKQVYLLATCDKLPDDAYIISLLDYYQFAAGESHIKPMDAMGKIEVELYIDDGKQYAQNTETGEVQAFLSLDQINKAIYKTISKCDYYRLKYELIEL